MKQLLLAIVAFVTIPANGWCEPHKIGAVVPLTGDFAIFGQDFRKGAEVALDEVNAKEKKLEVVFEDDKCLPKDGVTAYRKLTEMDKVEFVVGSGCSGVITAIGPLAERKGMPVLAVLDSTDQTKTAGKTTFLLGYDSADVAKLVANEMYRRGVRKAGVLCETDAWADLVKEQFKTSFIAAGGKIVGEVEKRPDDLDSKPALTQLLASHPDGLYLVPAYNGGRILQDLVKLHVILPVFGPDTIGNAAAREIAKDVADGVVYADIVLDESNPNVSSLMSKIEKRFGEKPHTPFYAALGYDSVHIALKSVTGSKPALEAIKEVTCGECTNPFNGFNKDRQASVVPTLLEIQLGEPVKVSAAN